MISSQLTLLFDFQRIPEQATFENCIIGIKEKQSNFFPHLLEQCLWKTHYPDAGVCIKSDTYHLDSLSTVHSHDLSNLFHNLTWISNLNQ